jgi:hypothetical protein
MSFTQDPEQVLTQFLGFEVEGKPFNQFENDPLALSE